MDPISNQSLLGSAQSVPVKPHPVIDYRSILNPLGVDFYNQNQLRKETEKEMKQMENRIRLLQLQELRMKKKTEMQVQKMEQMRALRE